MFGQAKINPTIIFSDYTNPYIYSLIQAQRTFHGARIKITAPIGTTFYLQENIKESAGDDPHVFYMIDTGLASPIPTTQLIAARNETYVLLTNTSSSQSSVKLKITDGYTTLWDSPDKVTVYSER